MKLRQVTSLGRPAARPTDGSEQCGPLPNDSTSFLQTRQDATEPSRLATAHIPQRSAPIAFRVRSEGKYMTAVRAALGIRQDAAAAGSENPRLARMPRGAAQQMRPRNSTFPNQCRRETQTLHRNPVQVLSLTFSSRFHRLGPPFSRHRISSVPTSVTAAWRFTGTSFPDSP